jgi:hypothetical protein
MGLQVRLLVVVACALCLIPAAVASANGFTVGISEQMLDVWQDPRFEALGVRQARLLVYYNHSLSGDFGAPTPGSRPATSTGSWCARFVPAGRG